MTSYSDQSVNTFSPIGATSQVSATSTSQAFALPSTAGATSPVLVIVSLVSGLQNLFIKFGSSGAVTVSYADGMKIAPGTSTSPSILAIPAGMTHIAMIVDGPAGTIALTGADGNLNAFAPNGASSDITVTSTTAAFAIPATGTGTAAIALVGLQSAQQAWFLKFGNNSGVTVNRTDGLKVRVGSADDPSILAVPTGATHFAMICEGPDGLVRLTGGVVRGTPAGSGTITNDMLANMAQATIKGRAVGAGTGSPQDLTGTQATAILDVFTSGLKGLTPASGGVATTFLNGAGAFTAPVTGMTLVGTWVWSTNTTLVDFTNLGGYSNLIMVLQDLTFGSASMLLRVSTDNGATFFATGADYSSFAANDSSGVSSTTGIALNDGVATSMRGSMLLISGWNDSNFKSTFMGVTFQPNNNNTVTGYRVTAEVNNALRIINSAGNNITAGTIFIYGIA